MANQKFSVEEILKEYQSDEATKGKKESPSGKLETQKMLNHAAGRRNVPPSTEASAEAYSYASSRTRQRTPYSPYRSEMAANINQIKQNRYQRRTDVEESRTAAFQTLELMRPKVSFVRSPAIRPQTTPNPKSDHISDYDGAVLLEQPESEQKPEQPVYQPAIQEMQDSTRAKEKKQAQKSRKPKKRTEQSYQRESLTEPEPEWRKAKTETFPAITPTQTLQETLREAQEAVAKAEAEAAAAVAALKAEQQQPQKKQPISHAFETLLTSPAKQQEKQQKHQQEKKQPVAKRWFSGKKRVPQVNHAAPSSYPEPAEAYRQPIELQPKPYTPPVQESVQEAPVAFTTSEPVEPTPEQKPKKKKWWEWWKKETPSVPKSTQPEESYMPPVQEEPVQPETSYIPPVQEPAQIEESPIITEPVEPTPVQKPKKQKKARKKKENPSKQQFAQPEGSYTPPVQESVQPEKSYAPPVQESAQPKVSYTPPMQEFAQLEESPIVTESEPVESAPVQKPKKQKKARQKKEKKPKKQKPIPVEKPTSEPVTNNVPNSEPEFAAGYAPAEKPLETDWTTEESSHSEWWDDSESKIPGSSGFDPTEEPAPQPEENESYTARFKKVVVQESTYTEPEQPKKPRKPKKEKTPRVKVQKPVPPEPKSIPNQEAEIRVNINLLRNAVFFRTVSLAVLTIIGAFLAIGESSYTLLYPALSQLMTVRGYCFLHLILGLLILFITFPTVINGMRKLFHREADSDTIAAMPLIPCLLTVLATIFVPEPMQHNLVHIFLPVSSFILLMNSIGKLFIIRRATRNFALLTKNFEKYIVTCVQSETAAEELTRGVVQDYPILATIRKTKQMSDFLRHTYASDLADRFSKKLAPIVAGISLLLAAAITGIRIGVLETPAENIPFFCSVLTMLLTAGCSAGIPLTVNLPLDRASKRLCPHGCTLLGYQSVDDFYDVNSILVPAATLFPKQSITISGIKNFSGFQVEEALLDAASMVYAADSILQNAFAALVEEKDGGMLYQVEDCSYEDNLGICGWIRHRRVLLGNREMMMAHHVEGMPTKVRELEMTSGSQDVLYLSVSGVVAGMFVIDITADPMVKRQMQRLKEEQISVVVKSVDSCITLQRLTTLFGVPDSMLKILPSADNDLYEKETAPLQDVSASTIHDGSFFGTARLLLEARSIKRAATTGLLLQVIAVILGLSICIGYILVNGYDNITSQTLLFFQLVMTGLTLLTTRLK